MPRGEQQDGSVGAVEQLPELRDDLLAVLIDGDLVVFDPADSTTHVLGGRAVALWAVLELHGGTSLDPLAALGAVTDDANDDQDPTTLLAEFEQTLQEFRRLDLVRADQA